MSETLRAAETLEAALHELASEIKALRAHTQRNRRMIWGLAGSVFFDVVLSVLLGIVAFQASNAASVAEENRRTLRATCESGNESRELHRSLWTHALDSDLAGQTPAERAEVARFRAYIEAKFTPRDCSRI